MVPTPMSLFSLCEICLDLCVCVGELDRQRGREMERQREGERERERKGEREG